LKLFEKRNPLFELIAKSPFEKELTKLDNPIPYIQVLIKAIPPLTDLYENLLEAVRAALNSPITELIPLKISKIPDLLRILPDVRITPVYTPFTSFLSTLDPFCTNLPDALGKSDLRNDLQTFITIWKSCPSIFGFVFSHFCLTSEIAENLRGTIWGLILAAYALWDPFLSGALCPPPERSDDDLFRLFQLGNGRAKESISYCAESVVKDNLRIGGEADPAVLRAVLDVAVDRKTVARLVARRLGLPDPYELSLG
jgi:hypothetical protein